MHSSQYPVKASFRKRGSLCYNQSMIKTIMFDFGDVLVTDTAHYLEKKYHYEKMPLTKKREYERAYHLSETGKISHRRLRGIISRTLTPSLTPDQVETELFQANRLLPPARLMKKLKARYTVLVLSNNHRGHPARVGKIVKFDFSEYPFVNSATIGMRKPSPGIYRYTLKKFRLEPKETVFIDDKRDNVAAARKFGIKAYLYDQDYGKLVKFLRSQGIKV